MGWKISCNRPDRPCGPPPVQWVPGLFPEVKWSERGVEHPLPIQRQGKRKSRAILLFPSWPFTACFRSNHTIYKLPKSTHSVSIALYKITQFLNSCKEKYLPLSISEVGLAVFRIHSFINTQIKKKGLQMTLSATQYVHTDYTKELFTLKM
jgi:hypothetical protein